MTRLTEADISTGILDAYYEKFRGALQSDVVIVGSGPSGLTAAWQLAAEGIRVVVLEKRLSPGGGIWGGSIDATGHEAVVVASLARRRHLDLPESAQSGEGAMDAEAGEAFVVDHVREVFPSLWVTGMSVCATQGGPRMGPIFGGMLMSGAKAAKCVVDALKNGKEH